MPKFIPDEILQKIQDALDIVDVISDYVKLNKTGRNFKALCPFHTEKTPSFIVSPDKQIYHCFGCGEGGNMFSFIMKYLNVKFPEAAEILADKAGIKIPKESNNKKSSKTDKFYQINKLVAQYYFSQLQKSEYAIKYIKRRGLGKDIVSKFNIGYAKDEWDQVLKFIKKKKISPDLLEKTGLVLSKESAGYYDRFRNRIMFPIFDISSRVLAFGGRALNDNSTAKYINSPETEIYSKRKHLYGLNFAKPYIREQDEIIVVEGYIDVLSLYQHGIKNVVSNLGTALTKEHISKIKRFTDNVLVVYDSDEAGKLASLRNLDLLIEEDMKVKLICLPSGKDPDDYIREFKKDSFLNLVKNAKDLLDYKLEVLDYKSKESNIREKKEVIEDILMTIGKVSDEILRNEYLNRLSDFAATGIKEEVLRRQLQSLLKKVPVFSSRNYLNSDKINVEISSNDRVSSTEKLLLRAMLEDVATLTVAKNNLNPDDLKSDIVKKIVNTIFELDCFNERIELDKLMIHLEDKKCNKLLAEIFCEFETMAQHKETLNDCIKSIEIDKLNSQLLDLKTKLKEANSEQKKELLFSYSNVCKEITNLKKPTKLNSGDIR